MFKTTFVVACLLAGLAACGRPAEPTETGERKTVSSMPEHFDRVRAEQVEKEEETLRRRVRN